MGQLASRVLGVLYTKINLVCKDKELCATTCLCCAMSQPAGICGSDSKTTDYITKAYARRVKLSKEQAINTTIEVIRKLRSCDYHLNVLNVMMGKLCIVTAISITISLTSYLNEQRVIKDK